MTDDSSGEFSGGDSGGGSGWQSWVNSLATLGSAGAQGYASIKNAGKKNAITGLPVNQTAIPTWLLPVALGLGAIVLIVVIIKAIR